MAKPWKAIRYNPLKNNPMSSPEAQTGNLGLPLKWHPIHSTLPAMQQMSAAYSLSLNPKLPQKALEFLRKASASHRLTLCQLQRTSASMKETPEYFKKTCEYMQKASGTCRKASVTCRKAFDNQQMASEACQKPSDDCRWAPVHFK